MRNVILFLAVALLVLITGREGAAYFEEGHLIRVVYERGGTKEIVTDLGAFDMTSPYSGPVVRVPVTFTLADLDATSWDDVYVAYVMRYVQGGSVFVWVSGDTSGAQSAKGSGGNALISKIGDLAGANMQTGFSQNVNLQSSSTSFAGLFGSGVAGTFMGFLTTPTGEANLAALVTGGSVTQYLYFFDTPTNSRNTYDGLPVFAIRTYADGATEIGEPQAPPDPAQPCLLAVSTVGNGTVTSSDGLIDCSSNCSREYPKGAAVYLTALAGAGSLFTGWSGDCTGTGNCALDMNEDRSVIATFSPRNDVVLLLSPADGATVDAASLYRPILFSWSSAETFAKVELQFWADNGARSPVKVGMKGGATEASISPGIWKKILKLPGSEGGTVSWRVVGIRKDGSTVQSAVHAFTVTAAEGVGEPRIDHASRTLQPPPALSWANRNNIKFRAWFGNGPDFTVPGVKKKALTFTIKDPLRNEGVFSKTLTMGQWRAIRRLVGDEPGATVYWYVESWDGVKRHSRTELKSFVLSE